MNTFNFKAKVATAEKNDEDGFFMVGLADDMYDFENYILLQKSFTYSEQDKENGMDGHYFELNGQENAAYKVCTQVILKNEEIIFVLDTDITEDLERVVIDISEAEEEIGFREYLQEIMGDRLVNEVE